MLASLSLFSLALLGLSLATLSIALVPNTVPRALQQASRDDVVRRLAVYPDRTWSANRAKRSIAPTCGALSVGGGTCGCSYTVKCNSQPASGADLLGPPLVVNSFSYCLQACDSVAICWMASWQTSTQLCSIYGSTANFNMIANTDYETAVWSSADTYCSTSANPSCGMYPPAGF
ncbi:hypothetical protein CALCODRAFT_558359 [Calocera cornea HHB12733]|uniref:Apple domain-containing protein n=1 Tax=Calocera cornea HHB12733 TaxID=1353952 RepID=A0A165D2B8_9BASI|nr:hypothetical protein CALCODRAFT_558359 [Calocera cornea HHB12733]